MNKVLHNLQSRTITYLGQQKKHDGQEAKEVVHICFVASQILNQTFGWIGWIGWIQRTLAAPDTKAKPKESKTTN